MGIRNVMIADDQNLFVNGLKQLIEGNGDVKISSIITKGSEVLRALEIMKPDVLLLDLNMPEKTGFEVLEIIRDKFPDLIIAILSTYDENAFIEKAQNLGANAYLSKDASVSELRKVIFNTHNLEFYLSKEINFIKRKDKLSIDNFHHSVLITNREKEILKLIAKGWTSKKIAKVINISVYTVQTHRKNLFKKLDVTSISELLKYAYEKKII